MITSIFTHILQSSIDSKAEPDSEGLSTTANYPLSQLVSSHNCFTRYSASPEQIQSLQHPILIDSSSDVLYMLREKEEVWTCV